MYFTDDWCGCWDTEVDRTNHSSETLPAYAEKEDIQSEVIKTIQDKLIELSPELRKLSLDIWRAYSICTF